MDQYRGTMVAQAYAPCRSKECNGRSKVPRAAEHRDHTEALRYKILAEVRDSRDGPCSMPRGRITLLELCGDMPQLLNDPTKESIAAQASGYNRGPADHTRNRKRHQSMPINSMNILKCFDDTPKAALSRTTTVDSAAEMSFAWAKLTTTVPLFEADGEPASSRRDGRITMTIGTHVLNGRYTDFESGDQIIVLRRVPDHCACVCSGDEALEHDCGDTHGTYFEICGVTNVKIVFSERPSIIQYSDKDQGGEPWFICQSQNMEQINTNWLLLRVSHLLVDDFVAERAYLKLVKRLTGSNESRLILSLNEETFWLERVELGGKFVLVHPMQIDDPRGECCNMLSIVGCCTFVHNIVKAVPNFGGLNKLGDVPLQNVLDLFPIADGQIGQFLIGACQAWPCEYIYLNGAVFAYVSPILSAEFSLTFLRVYDIHFSKHESRRKHVQELTVNDAWNLVQSFQQDFDFLPERMKTPAALFQILRFVCDLDATFTELEGYVDTLGSEEKLRNIRVKLNLFKIHRMVVYAIGIANDGRKLTYANVVKKVDSLLFTQRVPSYLFDEMIRYVLDNQGCVDEDYEDYSTCLKFYYETSTFSDVADKMSHRFKSKSASVDERQYCLTGDKMFVVNVDSDAELENECKTECFNYDIFKVNTKGITKLRFRYAMNTLLSGCRSPLSLHVAFAADRMVAIDDGDTCLLKVYPREKEACLRDALSSLFKLNQRWHLEVLEKKLTRFWGTKPALESLTGPPNFHARLWVTNEKNTLNYERANDDSQALTVNDLSTSQRFEKSALQPITEESYIIINSNVPI
ncbi:uncharacterized protein BcabD6B2_02590 [Babesia caballi]|uniref:Uncharacterized protein n=1 Tax=Babesia caballi TaxID=5871 RepID=A0AAV4LPT4_BABCB|nr:hypothetical protein, conserved [Babesia caballi]